MQSIFIVNDKTTANRDENRKRKPTEKQKRHFCFVFVLASIECIYFDVGFSCIMEMNDIQNKVDAFVLSLFLLFVVYERMHCISFVMPLIR